MIKLINLLKESVTFNIERRKLNIPLLIKKGALFITYPHGDEGWETNDEEDWSCSIITLVNVKKGNPEWQKEGNKPEYQKPKSYKHAEKVINSSKPNLGSSEIGDEKYQQILDSIKMLNISEKDAFLNEQ
jgi:hypothetical protein